MFQHIPAAIAGRMEFLARLDEEDRKNGATIQERLRQITPETGKFLALLLAGAPEGKAVEIGTSAGYSTMWLALACRETGKKLVTFELMERKLRLARETFRLTDLESLVELVPGDALQNIDRYDGIAFCFLDTEKELYGECYEKVIPRMVPGGILVADNAVSHQDALKPMIDRALNDERVDALVVPIGRGELVCRKKSLGYH